MKKLIAMFACACVCVSLMAACGSSSSSSSSIATYNVNDVVTAVAQAVQVENALDYVEDDLVFEMSMDMDKVEEFAGRYSNANDASAAVLVVKATTGNVSAVKEQLENYQVSRAAFLGNYPEFAGAKSQVEEGRIVVRGDYVILAFAAEGVDYKTVDEAIDSALQ